MFLTEVFAGACLVIVGLGIVGVLAWAFLWVLIWDTEGPRKDG